MAVVSDGKFGVTVTGKSGATRPGGKDAVERRFQRVRNGTRGTEKSPSSTARPSGSGSTVSMATPSRPESRRGTLTDGAERREAKSELEDLIVGHTARPGIQGQ